jgi:hypothetical protein
MQAKTAPARVKPPRGPLVALALGDVFSRLLALIRGPGQRLAAQIGGKK